MLTPAAAEKLIFSRLAPFHREDCPLVQAHGRSLRADLCADRDLPPFDRVTMDGYALRAASLAAGVTEFGVEGVQAAGMRPFQLGPAPGACLEIMTGAVLPAGADCVVPYEDTTRAATGATITVSAAAAHFTSGYATHRRGSDHRPGPPIVPQGPSPTARQPPAPRARHRHARADAPGPAAPAMGARHAHDGRLLGPGPRRPVRRRAEKH